MKRRFISSNSERPFKSPKFKEKKDTEKQDTVEQDTVEKDTVEQDILEQDCASSSSSKPKHSKKVEEKINKKNALLKFKEEQKTGKGSTMPLVQNENERTIDK
ncbi:hypothetical protein INT47_002029 [Mucor saturninus]|uniref:Uncharacterized protein n=1 Tax=Mucor saturninus TaxID=64648 RepID=A0A8H7QZP2_9FUNG|nr:hypothetical protein INT47_002029 [Mucor saturninus]